MRTPETAYKFYLSKLQRVWLTIFHNVILKVFWHVLWTVHTFTVQKLIKKALYFLEQGISEKAKIPPSTLTLSSLLGVTDLGLGRPWPGSRLRVKEKFGTAWISGEMIMWIPGGGNTGWVLETSPFLFPSWINSIFSKGILLYSARPTIRKVPGSIHPFFPPWIM